MQTIGDERNIQTLFRELRLEDERVAPRFSVVWNSAQTRTRPRLAFKLQFVAATIVLIVSLVSLALWLRGRQKKPHQENAALVPPSASTSYSTAPRTSRHEPNQLAPSRANYRVVEMRRARILAGRRRAELLALREAEIRNAAAVSSWQSPTAMLMQSPADDVLTSIPQLYRSVTELNLFLPDTEK